MPDSYNKDKLSEEEHARAHRKVQDASANGTLQKVLKDDAEWPEMREHLRRCRSCFVLCVTKGPQSDRAVHFE